MTEPAPQIGQVRLLTRLTTTELTDDEIVVLLELNGDVVKLAAADGLEIVAGQLTAVQSDDISIDGSKRAKVLMDRATRLREQAQTEADDAGFTFDVVEPTSCRPELTEGRVW